MYFSCSSRSLLIFFLLSVFHVQVTFSRLKSLQYDVECPFLTEREYDDRMKRQRCPPRVHTNETTAKPSMNPPNLKHGTLVSTIQKKLLKFVYFGKQRTITIKLSKDKVDNLNIIEGSFLDIRCDVGKKKHNSTQIHWFFDGLPLDPSVFNWRVQSLKKNQRILLAPTLSEYDNGLFECFVENDFRGGVHLRVKTIWNSVFLGFGNYLIGALFSLPLIVIATAYRLYRPEAHVPKPMDDLFDDEQENLHMEFDEMLLNLKKVEQT